ncbi:MAG: protein translocase subunit SecD [Planctomycetes bacterium]|nr:protein translocase subunit SecD [Planctomycetota bacterium]
MKGAGVLEFRIIPNEPGNPTFASYRDSIKKRGPRPLPGEQSYQWFEIEDVKDFLNLKTREDVSSLEKNFENKKNTYGVVIERFGDKYYVLSHIGEGYTMTHAKKEGESDWSLLSAQSERDEQGGPAIGFRLDTIGGSKFGPLTRQHRGQQLAIFIDDQCVSHARINSPITTSGIIQGRFTPQEVNDMVKKLNAGSLPQKLKDPPISVRSIGPSLGDANQVAGLKAGLIGASAVAIFMLVWYRYAGGVAMIAVIINLLFTFATMAILGATLTMPGIAGLVLAIGMGVDANVLINERIREELKRGTALRMAVKLGYERAFSAILDGNVTTLLTCIILYVIGSEQIKGFGLTLGIGVFINIFTAYFITRMFFDMMSMISIPREVKRLPLMTGLIITAAGALLYGIGYATHSVEDRALSTTLAFGESLIFVGPSVLFILGLMMLFRVIHGNSKDLPMAGLIGIPKVNWVGSRKVFFTISGSLFLGTIFLFMTRDDRDIYDIEFLGGVNAQIDLKTEGSIAKLPNDSERQKAIEEKLSESGKKLEGFGAALEKANITGASGTYTLATPGVPAARLAPVVRNLLKDELASTNAVNFSDPASEVTTVHLKEAGTLDATKFKSDLSKRFIEAGKSISTAQVQSIGGTEGGAAEETPAFTIVTRETIKDVVIDAITDSLENDLNIQQSLDFKLAVNQSEGGESYFPIRESDPKSLGIGLSDTEAASLELEGWQGGVAIVLEDVTRRRTLPCSRPGSGRCDFNRTSKSTVGANHACSA